jgi:2-(1,2-epoxy-1,2-dihydrophenyl)acetyl-CoA isomerase
MSDYESILLTVNDGVAILTLNRPEALNALTFAMLGEIKDALARIEEDRTIRALVVTGAGRGFCSGQDLRDRAGPGEDLVEKLMNSHFKAMNGIRTCRVPVIVAVNGTAAGAGFSLAMSGDIAMAARSAKFIQVFSRIALVPDCGSTYLLPRMIGRSLALKAMMTNDPIPAEQAREWGLVSDLYDDDDLLPAALELAGRLAKGPTKTLIETRKLVDEAEANSYAEQFRREFVVQEDIRVSHDAKEGVAAFIEKRAAEFRGE